MRYPIFLLFLTILLAGCRKTLCEPNEEGTVVEIKITDLLPDYLASFEGLSVRSTDVSFYPKGGGGAIRKHIVGDDGRTSIPFGEYGILIHTSDFYELDAVYYRGMNDIETAEAYARLTVKTPNPMIEEPDPLFYTYIENYVVDKDFEMIAAELRPLVYTYKMEIEVEGLQYAKSAQTKVTGVYTSAFLKSGTHRENEQADMVVDMRKEGGYIKGEFRCFGSHQRKDVKHTLSVAFSNAAGEIKMVELDDMTTQIKSLPTGGLIPISQKIVIKGSGGDGGFKPGIGDWDETEIVLPIH